VAEHRCQLDVNHRNGNHSDNSVENLQTLCANCHRLVTELAGHNTQRNQRKKQPHVHVKKEIPLELVIVPKNRILQKKQ